ncbi:hypothetical protein M5J20_07795 [Corynebacterium sp. TA-R-1]|uniref:Cadherin-like beta sandwich domain-containing protein n=1 Tax=Corynebacterium stercoris TaxID=2943490 RepID=A0ABT1G234_9CORY|nr:hypothetical protein [Corynebacterium stercoris]MCP1388089.1 hypothetical protein [Corynebacterium stercoris]
MATVSLKKKILAATIASSVVLTTVPGAVPTHPANRFVLASDSVSTELGSVVDYDNEFWLFEMGKGVKTVPFPKGATSFEVLDLASRSLPTYVSIRNAGDKVEISPKPGADGKELLIVFSDATGRKWESRRGIVVQTRTTETAHQLKSGETLDIPQGSSHVVKQGGDLITVTASRTNANNLTVTANPGVGGLAIVEVKDEWGNTYRHKITVVDTHSAPNPQPNPNPAPAPAVVTHNLTIHDRQDAVIKHGTSTNTLTIISGGDLIFPLQPTAGGWVLAPRQGSNGLVVLEERDASGRALARYELTIVPARVSEYSYNIHSGQKLDIRGSNLVLVAGEGLSTITQTPTTWTIQPKPGATGQIVIEGRDARGRVEVRYTLTLVQPPATGGAVTTIPAVVDHFFNVAPGGKIEFTITPGNTLHVDRPDVVTITEQGNQRIVTVKPGASGTVVITERDPNGNPVNRYTITIVSPPAGAGEGTGAPGGSGGPGGATIIDEKPASGTETVTPGGVPGGAPGQGGTIDIISTGPDGTITVRVPGTGGTLKVGDGTGFRIVDNGDGTWTITRLDGTPITGPLPITWTGAGGIEVTNTVTVTVDQASESGNAAGSSLDPKCIASLVGFSAPLLLLIPLGILAQVRVPGLEFLHDQLNGALQRLNAQAQQGLGIYDDRGARTAANAQAAFHRRNDELIGAGVGALALLALGLVAGDLTMRACGYGEHTSSQMIKNAIDKGKAKQAEKKLGQAAPAAPAAPAVPAPPTARPAPRR